MAVGDQQGKIKAREDSKQEDQGREVKVVLWQESVIRMMVVGREAVVNVRKVVGRVKANGQGQGQV